MDLPRLWPSDNEWGVPSLRLDMQADVEPPVVAWGSRARGAMMTGTWSFYTDDYRLGGVSVRDIQSRARTKTILRARQVTLYVGRAELGLTYAELGREVGIDHSSAVNAASRIVALVTAGDRVVLSGVAAVERAAIKWAANGPHGEEALRARRREIAKQLQELVAEAHRLDAMIAELAGVPERRVAAAE